MFASLERIKVQAMANSPEGVPQPGRYVDPEAIVLSGRLVGERFVWPWDMGSTTARATTRTGGPDFTAKIREAEDAEHVARDYQRAAALHREAVEIAETESARSTARLGLARALQGADAGAGAATRGTSEPD